MANRRAAIQIVERLREKGFCALLAGGCVRDMVLGRRPNDYDVATDARPEDVMALFPRTLQVGAKFGVVIVLARRAQVEVATFRSEAGYQDGRHPDRVAFTDAANDAARRDFTINGMFFDPLEEKVIDYVGGQADLQRQIVRTIGDPDERFGEDYLRMLRAIRFSTQLDFAIEPETFAAIGRNARHITKISGERIATELEAMLVHPNRGAGASMLLASGLAEQIFPGLHSDSGGAACLAPTGAVHTLQRLRKRVDFPLALAAFFCGCPAKTALEMCHILKLSRNQTRHLRFLLTHRRRLLDCEMALSSLKKLLAQPYYRDLYELERATQKAVGNEAALAALAKLHRRVQSLRGVDVSPTPLLDGHDLIRLGARPGPQVGQLAEELYIAQLENHLHTRRQAEQWVKDWLARH
ncbi:CCA tRNA nucleotidyltransferase [Anaerobaca lacustris]|uniref:CCA tRNA nucleotidyltransferase n=1 Tax=Anaerobaca lacustris TaxID=3044600 RepID=A0AAW6TXP7_9BACT|nr:CCA tRNA nucleotidyltransferase [Sedimentisphaerales bacterium M17dextr]